MPKIAGIPPRRAAAALDKGSFRMIRQGKHIVVSNGQRIVTIPRHNPVHALTRGGIVKDTGLTVEEFRALL